MGGQRWSHLPVRCHAQTCFADGWWSSTERSSFLRRGSGVRAYSDVVYEVVQGLLRSLPNGFVQ